MHGGVDSVGQHRPCESAVLIQQQEVGVTGRSGIVLPVISHRSNVAGESEFRYADRVVAWGRSQESEQTESERAVEPRPASVMLLEVLRHKASLMCARRSGNKAESVGEKLLFHGREGVSGEEVVYAAGPDQSLEPLR
jgi:hypothetical protein